MKYKIFKNTGNIDSVHALESAAERAQVWLHQNPKVLIHSISSTVAVREGESWVAYVVVWYG